MDFNIKYVPSSVSDQAAYNEVMRTIRGMDVEDVIADSPVFNRVSWFNAEEEEN